MNLHETIRQCRKARHISQEYMACQLGMSQSTYSRLEHGDWPIDDALLVKIAGLLRVCPNQLYAGNPLVFMATIHTTPGSSNDLIRQKDDQIRMLSETIQHLRAENAGLRERLAA